MVHNPHLISNQGNHGAMEENENTWARNVLGDFFFVLFNSVFCWRCLASPAKMGPAGC